MTNNNPFRRTWKDYFVLSNRQKKGIVVLFCILFIEVVVLYYLHFIQPGHAKTADQLTAIADSVTFTESSHPIKRDTILHYASAKTQSQNNPKQDAELFSFNPNSLPVEQWKRLGFSDKQIKVIKNYEAKGGKFYSKADVQKMYCISPQEYLRIEPYIFIPKEASRTADYNRTKSFNYSSSNLLINLTIADTAEIVKLPCIGSVKARIIVQYREKLGGFRSINQLHEVWGINDSIFEIIRPHVMLSDSINVKKIN